MDSDLLKKGDRVADRYLVERQLAKGGMGTVYVATHEDLGTEVAIKVLHMSPSEGLAARFLREARSAAKLKSEHIARVFDFGVLPSGHPFMVMELLTGADLDAEILKGKPDTERAVGHILQACEGVGVAHAAGLIHRDIKPSNLFVTTYPDGSPLVKVLDFGIAKESDSKLTGEAMGSPYYMSPEQAKGDPVDHRADIWSLGVTLFELLSGKRPFEAAMALQVCVMIMSNPPTSLRGLRPDLPDGLIDAIHQCLEKDPDKRPANVAELAALLAPYANAVGAAQADRVIRMVGGPIRAPLPSVGQLPESRPDPRKVETQIAVSSRPPPPQTSRAPLFIGLAAVVVLGGGLFYAFGRGQPTAGGTVPTATTSAAPSASIALVLPTSSVASVPSTPASTTGAPTEPPLAASSVAATPTHKPSSTVTARPTATVKKHDGTEDRK